MFPRLADRPSDRKTTNEDERQALTHETRATTLDVIREVELSVTFRQGKNRWRAEHDSTLAQL